MRHIATTRAAFAVSVKVNTNNETFAEGTLTDRFVYQLNRKAPEV